MVSLSFFYVKSASFSFYFNLTRQDTFLPRPSLAISLALSGKLKRCEAHLSASSRIGSLACCAVTLPQISFRSVGGKGPMVTALVYRSAASATRSVRLVYSKASFCPFSTQSPVFFTKRAPAAGSTASPLRSRPAPSNPTTAPISSVCIEVMYPLCCAHTAYSGARGSFSGCST